VVSRASSTLKGSLPCKDTDPSHLTPMEVAEGPSALEVAAATQPPRVALVATEPPRVLLVATQPLRVVPAVIQPQGCSGMLSLSLSTTSMDVHVGSPPIRFEEVTATHASTTLTGQVALEVGEPDARSLLPASGAEVTPGRALEIVPADLPSSSHAPTLPALGLPLFLSNLQVSQPFALYCPFW
jgi:hypothetical protein